MEVEDVEGERVSPPIVTKTEKDDKTEPVTQVQMNGLATPPPSNETEQQDDDPSSPLPSNDGQQATRPLSQDGKTGSRASSPRNQEVIQPTSQDEQTTSHDEQTTGEPVSLDNKSRQNSDSDTKENEANQSLLQNDSEEKMSRPSSRKDNSGETSRPTSRSDTPVKATRSFQKGATDDSEQDTANRISRPSSRKEDSGETSRPASRSDSPVKVTHSLQEGTTDDKEQDTADRISRPSSKPENDLSQKTPSRERTPVDRTDTPTDKAGTPVERTSTPINETANLSRQNTQGRDDKEEITRLPSNMGAGTTSRPHSQMNGHVQENTDKILHRRTPTPQNISRPTSETDGVMEDISILPLSRKGSAFERQSRPSSRASQRLLPEVRQTTPINLVSMGDGQHSRPTSRGDELKPRQTSDYGHLPERSISPQVVTNQTVQLESSYVYKSRPTSRGSVHSTNQQRPPSKTSDNSNTSILLDKMSRPTSKDSNDIDNRPQSLMRVTSPQQHQQSTTLTFNGTSSITPRNGVNSITPRISAISTKCSMCQNSFTDPRLLPCLHSLCFGCLDAILESNKTQEQFSCPECEEKISVLSPELLHNVYLQGILGIEATKTGEAHRCVVCSLKNLKTTATHQCLDCVDLLCDNCGNAHASTRATVDHLVVSLNDLATGDYDSEIRQRTRVKCRSHIDQPYEHFCTVCDTMICRECRLTDHVGHKHVSIEDAHKKNERKLLDMLQKAIDKQRRITGKERRIEKNSEEIDSMESTLAKYIEKVTQEIINKLMQEKDFALMRLRKHMDKQRVENLEQKTEVDVELKRLNAGIDFCNEVVKHGRADEMLFVSPLIQKRLQHLLASNMDTKQDNPVDFPSVSLRDEFRNVEDLSVFYFIPEDENGPSKLAQLPGKPSVSLNLLDRINVLGPRDYLPPKITGLACTGDGSIVVGDSGNVNVKLFSSKGKYIDTLMSCKPVALAASNNVVAVSDRFSVLLISTDKKFRRRIPMESNGSILALTSFQGRYFAVLVPISHLFKVYDTKGDFVRDFPMVKPRRRGMQRTPMFLAANNQGELIFSDWGSNSIVHINDTGEILHEYKCGNIGRYNNGWNPGGLSVDSYDNILIADQQNGEVLVLNKDLRIIYKRKMRKDSLDKPLLISGNNHGHFFVAGKGGSVNVYMIKYA